MAMRTNETLTLLDTLSPVEESILSCTFVENDAAYVRLRRSCDEGRWAMVSSPGDRWFSLDVNGGFSLNHFEEDTPEVEARAILERYVALAVIYLKKGGNVERSGFLRSPHLVLTTDDGAVTLQRSVTTNLKAILGR